MQTDGCEHVRAEGLSIWVSLFLMSLFAVSGGCIMHVVVCFWPDMAISKLLRFLIAGLRGTISAAEGWGGSGLCMTLWYFMQVIVSKVADLIAIKRCEKSLPPLFLNLFDPCAWRLLTDVTKLMSSGGWTSRGRHFERRSCHTRGGWCFYLGL